MTLLLLLLILQSPPQPPECPTDVAIEECR